MGGLSSSSQEVRFSTDNKSPESGGRRLRVFLLAGVFVWIAAVSCGPAPDSLSTAFAGLIRRSNLPRIRFHDLRHSHATQLLRHGIHPKVVSERLGHSKVGITLDTYSHVLPGMQEEAADKLDAALRVAMERQKDG